MPIFELREVINFPSLSMLCFISTCLLAGCNNKPRQGLLENKVLQMFKDSLLRKHYPKEKYFTTGCVCEKSDPRDFGEESSSIRQSKLKIPCYSLSASDEIPRQSWTKFIFSKDSTIVFLVIREHIYYKNGFGLDAIVHHHNLKEEHIEAEHYRFYFDRQHKLLRYEGGNKKSWEIIPGNVSPYDLRYDCDF